MYTSVRRWDLEVRERGKWGSGKEVETKHGSFKGTVAGKIPWGVVARRHKDNDFSDQYKLFFEL